MHIVELEFTEVCGENLEVWKIGKLYSAKFDFKHEHGRSSLSLTDVWDVVDLGHLIEAESFCVFRSDESEKADFSFRVQLTHQFMVEIGFRDYAID